MGNPHPPVPPRTCICEALCVAASREDLGFQTAPEDFFFHILPLGAWLGGWGPLPPLPNGSLKPGRSTVVGGAAAMFARPGFEPPTKKSAVSCITIRPLLALSQGFSPLLGAASATDKDPKLCVSV